jgi:hypothetical protein
MRPFVLKTGTVALMVLLLMLIGNGCGSTRKSANAGTADALLRYIYPEGTLLEYQMRSDIIQTVIINQQRMQTNLLQEMKFQIHPRTHPSNDILLGVALDSFHLQIESEQGTMNPDLDHLMGREFDLLFSSTGKPLESSEARLVEFEIVPGAKRNLEMLFTFLFPQLPDEKVTPGDEWIRTDTISEQYEGESLNMILTSMNTLESIETVNALRCAKVRSTVMGKRTGETNNQGVPMSTTGSVSGSGVFYLVLNGGYILGDTSRIFVDGSLTIEGAQRQTFPLQLEMKTAVGLVQ